jgi:sarcosine oxidase
MNAIAWRGGIGGYHTPRMTGESFDVIVIGVGGMGSAACYHLARRGVRVLGLEQFDIPHTRGSSHGHTRMIRTAYFEHPDYVPLLRRAWELWKRTEEESLVQVLHPTGGLYLGPREGELVGGSLRASQLHNLPYELLEPRDLRSQYPQFQVPDEWVGLYEYQAGFLNPELAISVHADLAMRHGADIRGNEPVLKWETSDRGASVTTTKGTYSAGELVFCGGAWSDKLVADLGVPLVVTRQVLGWVQPRRRDYFRLGALPVWATDNGDGTIYYGFPLIPESPGLKLAHHGRGTPTDPDTVDRNPRPGDEETFRPALRQFLPDADGPVISMRICLYTNSPDGHFIVDRPPSHPHVTIACGFSGHGFKFCSVIGEALADLATKGMSELPIGFLGLERFAR